jgi:hypothetical protein
MDNYSLFGFMGCLLGFNLAALTYVSTAKPAGQVEC